MTKNIIRPSANFRVKTPLIKPLIWGVLAYIATVGLSWGQDADSSSETLKLKLEDQLLVRPLIPDEQAPTFTSSKSIDGVVDREMRLEGDAVIRRNRTVIKGDVIIYDPDTDIANVDGNAFLLKGPNSFEGPRAKLRVDAQEGWMEQPKYQLREAGASGQANRVDFYQDDQIELNKLTYTTCRPDNVDWYLSATHLDIDQDTQQAVGTNGVFHFFNVPILYTPIFALPLNSDSRSGFLPPTYGYASRGNWSGWDITLPYYMNIAPNRDLTIYPRYLEGRGTQLGGEFRYLDRNYVGILSAEALSDKVTNTDRWAFSLKHAQNISTGLVAYTDFNKVSDNLYVDDLGKSLNGVVNRQFNQEVGVRYVMSGWSVLTRVQNFQTLQPDPTVLTILPYGREPQINAQYKKVNWEGVNFGVETDFTHFTYAGQKIDATTALANGTTPRLYQDGNRAYINTYASMPYITPGYYITPKISLKSTQYSVTGFTGENDVNRNITLPTLSLDSGLTFERDAMELGAIFGRNMLMTLEPRLFYVYTPYTSQSTLPLFDTADAGFGISQIFSENSFAGNDRIADNNKLTVGVTSRILDADSGVERLRGTLAQRIDFSGQRVGLTNDVAATPRRTDILAGLATRLVGNFNIDTVAEYNPALGRVVQSSVTASYRPEQRKLFNVSYRSTFDPSVSTTTLDQYEISGQWPITRNWYGVARYNYDFISGQVLNRLAGVEYDADCWVARVVQRRFQNTSSMTTSEIYMQIDFKGFSGWGSNPINLVRFNVPGYEPINSLPAPISPFESYE
jgi:LPS-assembly protein